MTLDTTWLITVFLVVIRLSGLLLLTPLTPIRQLPIHARLFFLVSLSIALVSGLGIAIETPDEMSLILAAGSEVINGLILGLSLFAAFATFSLAGLLIDSQMGLNSTTILNPQAKTQEPIMGHLLNLIAVLVFFASGLHRLLFKGIAFSLKQLPPGKLLLATGLKPALTQFSQLFLLGLMLASPIVFTLFFIDIASGIITRTMPQVSVYFITLPIKILLGFVLIIMSLKLWMPIIERVFNSIFTSWQGLLA